MVEESQSLNEEGMNHSAIYPMESEANIFHLQKKLKKEVNSVKVLRFS